MDKRSILILAAASLVVCSTACAQPTESASGEWYAAFGEKAGIAQLVQIFLVHVREDARLKDQFAQANFARLQEQLTDQFCHELGGPCQYTGADMKSVHEAMEIRRGDFNALVEVLEQSMVERDIPFAAQRRLLARLAPMHRDVVNVP